MKKLFKLVLCSVLFVSLVGCSSAPSTSDVDPMEEYGCDTLNVYNWGEYIGETVNSDFEDAYNVRINYSLFSSNEEMYTKLVGGSKYDVIIPSEYTIERLINEDLLLPLDRDVITNFDNLVPSLKGLPYDEENAYSIPYFWGTVGIVYDHTTIDPELVEELGYNIFHDESIKGRSYFYDSERDGFMVAFKALGYSMNTENEEEINEAYAWLQEMVNTIEPAFVTDEAIDGLIYGEKEIGIMYSGDAAYILSENENMSFYAPEEGTNLWSDAMAIPANASCPALANEYINYMLEYETSVNNSSYVGYASTNQEALDFLSSEEGDYFENEAYLPRIDGASDEVFTYNKVLIQKLADLWIKVKIGE